tara:strand:- start:83 stop:493 length:411 start_codon:yes stop_codon:yes gene_type:complete
MADEPLADDERAGLIPYPHHRGSQVIRKEDFEPPIIRIEVSNNEKLKILKRQADLIVSQIEEIMENENFTKEVYSYEIRFEPVIGGVYHVYERVAGDRTLSIISPSEYGNLDNYKLNYIMSVKLRADDTWEKVDDK